jgi:hypothetical protein
MVEGKKIPISTPQSRNGLALLKIIGPTPSGLMPSGVFNFSFISVKISIYHAKVRNCIPTIQRFLIQWLFFCPECRILRFEILCSYRNHFKIN